MFKTKTVIPFIKTQPLARHFNTFKLNNLTLLEVERGVIITMNNVEKIRLFPFPRDSSLIFSTADHVIWANLYHSRKEAWKDYEELIDLLKRGSNRKY